MLNKKNIAILYEKVNKKQKHIVLTLEEEGWQVDEGWTYDVCREILLRLSDQDFEDCLLLKPSVVAKIQIQYHNDYLAALKEVEAIRLINNLLHQK